MFLNFSFIFFSFLALALSSLASNTAPTAFFYNDFTAKNLFLDGIAEIHTNGLLQLTNTSNQQVGHAFYTSPINFTTSRSFSTNFVFAMCPNLPSLGGHGIAFVISPSTDFSQAVESQYLGLFNATNNGNSTNHVLAVEFDTIKSPEFDDINDNHVGIDVNSLESVVSAPVSYFSSKEEKLITFELISGDAIQGWIEYDDEEMLLNVSVAPVKCKKPEVPLISKYLNLSEIFRDEMFVGFSGSTGAVSGRHYVLGWSFNASGEAKMLEISKLPQLPKEKKRMEQVNLYKLVVILIVLMFLVTVSGAVWIHWRRKYAELREDWEKEFGPQRFSFRALHRATRGFRDKIGEGGFGEVYKGILPNSDEEIAVKRVSHTRDSGEAMKQFVSEIVSMRRLMHRNLVRLLGYSRKKGELLLVYDYMSGGSLDKFLFRNENPNLNWPQRFRILRGVASALLYLHEEWEQVVIHRDVKASNVLLDSELNGRLTDFGLARLHDHGNDPHSTLLVGTLGYIAPELSRTGKAVKGTDVYAFGVLLLEVACGRKPIELQGMPEEVLLVDWVRNCWQRGEILGASDPRLEGEFDKEEMKLVLKLGLLCSHSDPETRPGMKQVMKYLDGNASLPETIPVGNVEAENAAALLQLLQLSSAETSISVTDSVESGIETPSPSLVYFSSGRLMVL